MRFDFGQFCYAIDQSGDFGTKFRFDIFNRRQRVLYSVVQQGGNDGIFIHLQVGHQARNFDRMAEIGVARRTLLRAMHLHGEDIGLVEPIFVYIRIIGADPLDQFILTHHHLKLGHLRCDATGKIEK